MQKQLSNLFVGTQPLDLSQTLERYACVSLILRGPLDDLQIGFIQRAVQPNDRWSGQIAFPGGKKEDIDSSALATALRETQEEVGIILTPDEMVGRLDDIQARKAGSLLDFFIRPFVFYTERDFAIQLDPNEVADFFWVPLKQLDNPDRKTTYELTREQMLLQLPAISLDREIPLWGLSYMITQDLLIRLKTQISF
ncbi:CoA pyrophosphatase [Bdellovibrio sp. SKB1291214]|uniref:NUDIX hydrolase n=1 Tax=Bdellovibrio sp. SKB1291214 TaxID=1732569 RepID=UPI000B5163B6|nr:CoA pyrophosphatase [Bdellovibrio sp. SKB1291214]UYL09135.1 CoA pyrophosphatase [Bdellovibrio sp. SKB1291214]